MNSSIAVCPMLSLRLVDLCPHASSNSFHATSSALHECHLILPIIFPSFEQHLRPGSRLPRTPSFKTQTGVWMYVHTGIVTPDLA